MRQKGPSSAFRHAGRRPPTAHVRCLVSSNLISNEKRPCRYSPARPHSGHEPDVLRRPRLVRSHPPQPNAGTAGKALRIIERLNFQSTAQTIASWVAFAVLLASAQTAPGSEASEPRETRDIRGPESSFPRLMGMNIGAKNYDDPAYQRQLARLDVVILGFYKGWKPGYGMAKVVRNLKELSGGKILVGQYTILNECGDDPKNSATLDVQTKLNDMDWWARKADGSRVQWTAQYRSWDINFTTGSRPDAIGQRFPQSLAERDDRVFFKPVPFDLWYCDNVFFRPRVTADRNHVGADGDPKSPAVAAAYRAGHRAEWDHIRRIHPGLLLMGNTDGDLSESEYAGQLESAFLEGLMGKSWSIETWGGWSKVMSRYHAAMANTRSPHIVGFNVHGDPTDYRFFRYAYASCLLDDGYFCFTAKDKEYSSALITSCRTRIAACCLWLRSHRCRWSIRKSVP